MKHYYWLVLLLCSSAILGQAQTLDPTFQPTTLLNQSPAVRVLALVAQADGKSLVAGNFQAVSGTLSNNVLRLNTDLSRDLSFRPGPGANGPVQALVVQTDGTILIGGNFTAYAGTVTGPVARLLPTGELDSAFHLDPALVGGQVATLLLQADGRILVGGPASASLSGGLVRLLPTGELDPTFRSGAGVGSGGQVLTLAVQHADNRIVVGGTFTSFNGRLSQSLVRLLPTGTPDPDFTPPAYAANTTLYSLALLPDGSLLVGGTKPFLQPVFQRLLPSGLPDPQFMPKFDALAYVRSIQVDPSGRILVAGSFTTYAIGTGASTYRNSVVRLLADGTPDPSFLPATTYAYGNGRPDYSAVLPLPTGQLLLGGGAQILPVPGLPAPPRSSAVGLHLLSAAGVRDVSFSLPLAGPSNIQSAVPLASGKLLVTGTYTSFNGQPVTAPVQRLQADGSLDQDLTTVTGPIVDRNGYIFPQPDGQVYAVETATICLQDCGSPEQKTVYQHSLRRIQADNVPAPALTLLLPGRPGFTYGSYSYLSNSFVQQVLLYPTGEILVAFYGVASAPPTLAKFQASGAPSASFAPPAFLPVGSVIDQLLTQADGKTLVRFHLATGQIQLVRLLSDGQLDPAFTVNLSLGLPAGASFGTVLLQPDGQLLLTGSFTSFAGVATPTGTVRLSPTGSVDASFQPSTGLAPLVPLACLPDGRLLVRANSQTVSASLRRLLADGSSDPSFTAVTLTTAAYPTSNWNIVLQPGDFKPVLYGDFDHVNNQLRTGLARLGATSSLATRIGSRAAAPLSLYPNPAHQSATLVLPTALTQASTARLYDALGREVRHQPVPAYSQELTLLLHGLSPGLYLLRCGTTIGQLVVE